MDELSREERKALVERSIQAREHADQLQEEARALERRYQKAERDRETPAALRVLATQVAEAFMEASRAAAEAAFVTRDVVEAMPMGITVGEWVEGEIKRN